MGEGSLAVEGLAAEEILAEGPLSRVFAPCTERTLTWLQALARGPSREEDGPSENGPLRVVAASPEDGNKNMAAKNRRVKDARATLNGVPSLVWSGKVLPLQTCCKVLVILPELQRTGPGLMQTL
ncbi:MAG: hypothetical protein C5B49_08065 [Bdellovibrio sp.]|nr:MAG: hypothetical protein C5B49_08065 [Bdellovibrio sp.]